VNKTIGRFAIKAELGRGAQSVVYLAHDPQLDREVALKTLHFSEPDSEQNKALLSEARMVSRLRHPGIVPIFDAGLEHGDPYLVFEYVPGENLATFMQRRGALPAAEAASLLLKILAAVGAAHAEGIIHRDLKPTNILMDQRGEPRVMDFGIACLSDGGGTITSGFSGSPAYMAPEYINLREVSPGSDIFAAGLILIEMLTGTRVFAGDDPKHIVRRIAREQVRLPDDAGIDDQLASIALTAVAFDVNRRYRTTADFINALNSYQQPTAEAPATSGSAHGTMEFLLRRMRQKSDFPALSESVSAINRIAASETESIGKLASLILRDVALTNKLLRLVNSTYFHRAGGGTISTVSRAVAVLGFDAVRNIAITVMLFEHLQNKANAGLLIDEFLRANFAGAVARGLARQQKMRDHEQAFICTVFHHLGRMLAQFYFPEECEDIRRQIQQKSVTESAAALKVLGISFEDLGMGVARTWGFPALIVASMQELPPGKVRKPANHGEKLRVVAAFSAEISTLIASTPAADQDRVVRQAATRYDGAIQLSEQDLKTMVTSAISDITDYAHQIRINLSKTALGKQLRLLATPDSATPGSSDAAERSDGMAGTALREDGGSGPDTLTHDKADKQGDAQSVLTAGIQDISNAMIDGFKLNDILRIILETMYRAMGFRRVLLCIKDARAGTMQGRFGFGPDAAEIAKRFAFSLQFTPDIFHAAMKNGVDILISDVDDPKISERIPAWYRKAVTAKTFVVLPLNLKSTPVALIYADREHANEIVITEKELSLLRTLRNQAVLAIKQSV
jgi:serine/threonine protein kinase